MQQKYLTDNEINTIANLYFTSLAFTTILDECKGFTFYQKEIKLHGNMMQKKLEPFIKNTFGNLFEVTPNATSNLHQNITELILRLSKFKPEELAVINSLLDAKEKNEASFNSFCAMNKIKIVSVKE